MNKLTTSDPSTSQVSTLMQCGYKLCDKSYLTVKKCSRCRSISYCGVVCQKADWPKHKKVCRLESRSEELKKQEAQLGGETTTTLDSSMVEKPMPIPGLRLIENFISDDLHDRFIEQMKKGIPEMNHGHYDGYSFEDNEAFDRVFYPLTKDVFTKLKKLDYFSSDPKPLKLACTLIGYKKDGFFERHVDSPLLSGGTVIVISFNSPVVLTYYSQKKAEEQQHKIFIPPKSMYSMTGEVRYEWSHAILKDENTYDSIEFARGVRYAILFTPPGPLYSGTELLDY